MSRVRSNCKVIEVEPRELVEFIDEIPAIVANWRSSGVATAFAIVAGLAPGKLAETEIVGKSIVGRSLTGNVVKLIMPKAQSPTSLVS